MRVTKRDGRLEEVSFDKVLNRIKEISVPLKLVDATIVAQKVCSRIYDKVKTSELDELSSSICTSMCTDIPDYGILASNLIISNNHKNTPNTFFECIEKLNDIKILDTKIYNFIKENKDVLNEAIDNTKDYDFSWFSFKTLEKSYLLKVNGITTERIQYMFMRVSCGIHYPDIIEVLKSYSCMSERYFTHATPTLFNSGITNPQLLSCFLTKPEDSIDGIYKWISNIAKISKEAGGIGATISNIRSKGSYIKGSNSYSSGIIPMLKVVNETMKYVNQGGRRAGSAAIYIEPHHPDIMAFLEIRLNNGNEDDRARDLFTAIWASDLFMKRVENNEDWSLFDPNTCPGLETVYGDEYKLLYETYEKKGLSKKVIKAHEIWKAITRSQIETGTPYIGFKDSINKKSNQQNYGVIQASNLCVAPETLILTDNGYYKICDLENKYVNVWNGEQFSEVLVRKTGENQKLIKVQLSNGAEIDCTEYHKFYIAKKRVQPKPLVVEAKDLKKDMKIWKCEYPVIKNGIENFKYPYNCGFICGNEMIDNNLKLNLLNKFDVPLYCNLSIKLRWLEGYMDGARDVDLYEINKILQSFSVDKKFLEKIRLMCQTMGIDPKIIYCAKQELIKILDNENTDITVNIDLNENTDTKDLYQFLIEPIDLYKLIQLGFSPKKIKLNKNKPKKNERSFIKVLDIKDEGRISDTYCFREPLKNAGIFNGVYTGQCIEITEYHDEKEYACCCLSSICLPRFLNEKSKEYNFEKLEEISSQMVKNLNKVIDVNFYPVPETKYSNLKHRPIGIGVQGLADVFCIMRYPFDSKEALELNNQIFETIYYGALKASLELAKKYGPYETFHGSPISKGKFQFDLWGKDASNRYNWEELRKDIMKYGVRNSLLIACMPTASTSQIMGCNECIEPFTSNMYVRRTLSGEFIVSNKYMISDLLNLGIWNKELKDIIIANNGSIQNIDCIPNNIKKLYKTSWELKQKSLMDLSIGRGQYICQTQSLNLFFEEPTTKILTSAMFYAWKNGLKTGVYYVRSRPKTQAQQFTIDPKLIKNKELQDNQDKNKELQDNQDKNKELRDNQDKNKELLKKCNDDVCYSCSG